MKMRIWIVLLGLYLTVTGTAQSSLGVDSLNVVYTTPTYFNNTNLYKVNIWNAGPQTYTGSITVVYAVDSTGTGTGPLIVADTSYLANINLTTFGSGVSDSTYIIISPAFYRSGINTVVIWPRVTPGGNTFTTHDSLKINVLVLGWAGIETHELYLKASVFPNPARQELLLLNGEFTVERVRIFDLQGKTLSNQKFSGKINVSALQTGTYILEVQGTNGQHRCYRFVKE